MIKIFTNSRFPKCKDCLMVKKYLHSLELEYEEIDVVSNMQEYKNTIADKKGKEEYKEHIDALGQARKDKNLAIVKYNTFKKWVDLLQTKEANKRAEMMIK